MTEALHLLIDEPLKVAPDLLALAVADELMANLHSRHCVNEIGRQFWLALSATAFKHLMEAVVRRHAGCLLRLQDC